MMAHYLHGRSTRRGFTLVEFVVVALVLGIMAGVAAPKYVHALANYRASGAAARVAADLRLARQYARNSSVAQSVTFNIATETYSAPTMPDVNRPGVMHAVSLTAKPFESVIVSAEFNGTPTVQFNIFGRPISGGWVIVESGSVLKTVVVDALGGVRIL